MNAIKGTQREAKRYGMVKNSYYLLRDCGGLGGILLRSPFKRHPETRNILADDLQLLCLWDSLCCICWALSPRSSISGLLLVSDWGQWGARGGIFLPNAGFLWGRGSNLCFGAPPSPALDLHRAVPPCETPATQLSSLPSSPLSFLGDRPVLHHGLKTCPVYSGSPSSLS